MGELPPEMRDRYAQYIKQWLVEVAETSREDLERAVVLALFTEQMKIDGVDWRTSTTAFSDMYFSAAAEARTDQARSGGNARWAADPKSEAKLKARAFWDKWQSRPETYASKAEFARKMLDEFPALTSQKVIEDWTRDWDAEIRKK